MNRDHLPLGHRLARLGLAAVLLAAVGAGVVAGAGSGWWQSLIAAGQAAVAQAHHLWN
jgi:hypothetical protein